MSRFTATRVLGFLLALVASLQFSSAQSWRHGGSDVPGLPPVHSSSSTPVRGDGVVAEAPKLHRGPVDPHWIGRSSRFWYRVDVPGGEEFMLVDGERGTREPAFDHARARIAIQEAKLGPVTQTTLSPDARALRFRVDDGAWTLNLDTYVVTPVGKASVVKPAGGADEESGDNARTHGARSPDAKWEAFARDDNLWLRELATKREFPLSVGGSPGHTYRRDASRARLVNMRYDRADYPASEPDVRWSPDSRRLVAMQTRVVPERRVTLVESSPADQLQPKLSSYPYLKPGDEIPVSRPHLFDVAAEREIPLDQSRSPIRGCSTTCAGRPTPRVSRCCTTSVATSSAPKKLDFPGDRIRVGFKGRVPGRNGVGPL